MQLVDRNFERQGHARFKFCDIDSNPMHLLLANLHYMENILCF
jgi:hypothetical protein